MIRRKKSIPFVLLTATEVNLAINTGDKISPFQLCLNRRTSFVEEAPLKVKDVGVIHRVDCESSGVKNALTDTVNVFMEVFRVKSI